MKRFLLYSLRWQLSTPILYLVIVALPIIGIKDKLIATIIANLIGACIFFWVDKLLIFRPSKERKDVSKIN